MQIADKTVVITGAARGLGFAMAERFAAHGASIVIGDVRAEAVAEAVGVLQPHGLSAHGVVEDVSQEGDAVRLMDEAAQHFGSLNVVILIAGILRDGFLVKANRETGAIMVFVATEMVLREMKAEALEKLKPRIPIGRLGEPDEIAHTAQFIVKNDLICGGVLEANGGLRI